MVEFATLTESHLEPLRLELIERAAASMAKYPQYNGHFLDYMLVRVNRDIKTKAGLAFSKGEITIAKPDAAILEFSFDAKLIGKSFLTVWSFKNTVDTSIQEAHIKQL